MCVGENFRPCDANKKTQTDMLYYKLRIQSAEMKTAAMCVILQILKHFVFLVIALTSLEIRNALLRPLHYSFALVEFNENE